MYTHKMFKGESTIEQLRYENIHAYKWIYSEIWKLLF